MTDQPGSTLLQFFADQAAAIFPAHRPWPRYHLSELGWRALVAALAAQPHWDLLDLWAEPGLVHAALRDRDAGSMAVASLDCPDGAYPSLGGVRPGAIRMERAVRDL